MYIDELEEGKKIKLAVRFGKDNMEFETTIKSASSSDRAIYVDVIKKDDKIVGFNAKGVLIDVFVNQEDSAPLVFRNVHLGLYRYDKEEYAYQISSEAPGVILNRREVYRVYLGLDTALQCGRHHKTFSAIIKDVSSLGFSVTMDPRRAENQDNNGNCMIDFYDGQIIHVTIDDRIEELYRNYNFQLYGIIKRKQVMENGLYVYGCKLNQLVPGFDNYIAQKERIRIKHKMNR